MKKSQSKRSISPAPKSTLVVTNGKVSFRKKRKNEHVVHGEDLSDGEWTRISKLERLPSDARIRIVAAIAMYRDRISAARGSLKTKRRVGQMRRAIRKLLAEAEELINDPVFFRVGLPHWLTRTGPVVGDIAARTTVIAELDEILADAEDRMRLSPGRKSPNALEALIQNLVWIQADATERYVQRSSKSGYLRPTSAFITVCAKIADPSLSQSSIDNALTKCIAEHHWILENERFNTAVGKRLD